MLGHLCVHSESKVYLRYMRLCLKMYVYRCGTGEKEGGLKRNKSREDPLLHVNDCAVLQHKHPRDSGVSEDPVASVWFLLPGHAALTDCFQ